MYSIIYKFDFERKIPLHKDVFRRLLILHLLGLLEGLHRKPGVPNSIYSHVRFFSVNVIALITITVKFKRKRKKKRETSKHGIERTTIGLRHSFEIDHSPMESK